MLAEKQRSIRGAPGLRAGAVRLLSACAPRGGTAGLFTAPGEQTAGGPLGFCGLLFPGLQGAVSAR